MKFMIKLRSEEYSGGGFKNVIKNRLFSKFLIMVLLNLKVYYFKNWLLTDMFFATTSLSYSKQ